MTRPPNIPQAEWDSLPDYVKAKILRNRKEQEAKASLLDPADAVKGVVATEAGLPMDMVSILSTSGAKGQAKRLTKKIPGGQ